MRTSGAAARLAAGAAVLSLWPGSGVARAQPPVSPPAQAQPYDVPSLERTYRRHPSPGVLYQLGRVARAEGRALAAADLWRRYLEEAGDSVPPKRVAEVKEFLGQVREPAAEVEVLGDSGAILLLDGRVVGALPLPLPLLVAPGAHQLRLEGDLGRRHAETQLTLRALSRAEVRFTLEGEVAMVTLMPAVVLVMAPGEATERLLGEARRALSRERVFLVPRDAQERLMSDACAGSGVDAPACQQELLRRAEARYLLHLQLLPGAQRLVGQVVEAATGAVSARGERLCPGGVVQAETLVGDLLHELLLQGETRARGALSVTSAPSGAALSVDGVARGRTPYTGAALSGPHKLELTLSGYRAYQTEVSVAEGTTAAVVARLQPTARPRTLRTVGWTLVGIGAAGALSGGVLLGLDGRQDCPLASIGHCPDELDTRAAGILSLTVGGLGLGVGAALLLIDFDRAKRGR